MVATVQKCYYEALKTLNATRSPELHWQLTITHRGSQPNLIFQNSLRFVVFVPG